jgi:hypothetical protein
MAKFVNVLGTKYHIRWVDSGEDEYMEKMSFGGYCDARTKEIVILDLKTTPEWKNDKIEVIRTIEKETLRHEIVHAFLNESGLQWNSFTPERAWAKNEEMVDWISLQGPKIFEAWQKVGAM